MWTLYNNIQKKKVDKIQIRIQTIIIRQIPSIYLFHYCINNKVYLHFETNNCTLLLYAYMHRRAPPKGLSV